MSNQAQSTNDKRRGGGTRESPSPKCSPVKGEEVAALPGVVGVYPGGLVSRQYAVLSNTWQELK